MLYKIMIEFLCYVIFILVCQAYDLAMTRCLYDSVPVHGPQGITGPQKAYACTNCMEFFAELSVAYHWQSDDTTEYNKWFPHNRRQLQEHDPETFELLRSIWNGDMVINAVN